MIVEGTNFGIRLRDYHENSGGVTNIFTMTVTLAPPFSLGLMVSGVGSNRQAELTLHGTTGQRQVVETSSDLKQWMPLATNLSAMNLFHVTEAITPPPLTRFYRALVSP